MSSLAAFGPDAVEPPRRGRHGRVIGLVVAIGLVMMTVAVVMAVVVLAPAASAAGGCGG
jgi:hypothetical protein